MIKFPGSRAAVAHTGSTTGMATTVLALLSAGTLATFGLVSTADIAGSGPGLLRPTELRAVHPPAVVFAPAPPAPARPVTHPTRPRSEPAAVRPEPAPAAITVGRDAGPRTARPEADPSAERPSSGVPEAPSGDVPGHDHAPGGGEPAVAVDAPPVTSPVLLPAPTVAVAPEAPVVVPVVTPPPPEPGQVVVMVDKRLHERKPEDKGPVGPTWRDDHEGEQDGQDGQDGQDDEDGDHGASHDDGSRDGDERDHRRDD